MFSFHSTGGAARVSLYHQFINENKNVNIHWLMHSDENILFIETYEQNGNGTCNCF